MPKQRLDQLLVARGLVDSRQKAQALIRSGQVRVAGEVVDQPSFACPDEAALAVESQPPFVSRGGEKLQGALDVFSPNLSERVCLDGGISTGGFTDCLLQNGAARVYGIDVGYGQVAWKLRTDPRVTLKERCNLRNLHPEDLYQNDDEPRPDFATVDISFISVRLVLPALQRLLIAPRELLILVKPQFEAGRDRVGRNGVVREAATHRDVISGLWQSAHEMGWGFLGLTGSPLVGPAGNHEYWLWLSESSQDLLDDAATRTVVSTTLA